MRGALLAVTAAALLVVVAAFWTPSPSAGAGSSGCVELAVDGGFEQGGLGWQQEAAPPLPSGVSLIDPFYPYEGVLGAYLAGRNGAVDRLGQVVALPNDAISITVSFWWSLNTQEAAGAYDFLQVGLYEPDGGTPIAVLATLDNQSQADWLWGSAEFDLTPYTGRKALLRFTATNDTAGSPTAFFVDDVSITACAAGGTTPTVTLNSTPTATVSPTRTATATATTTPTATGTATAPSPGATVTSTATASPASTMTATAAATATPTMTITATQTPPGASATPTPTTTSTAVPTVTPTASLPAPTATPTGTSPAVGYQAYLPLLFGR